jgi:hypothetical protein
MRLAGLKVNAKKSFFAKDELECLGCWVTCEGIQPMPKKTDAMMHLEEPKTRKQLRGFTGMTQIARKARARTSLSHIPAIYIHKYIRLLSNFSQRESFL